MRRLIVVVLGVSFLLATSVRPPPARRVADLPASFVKKEKKDGAHGHGHVQDGRHRYLRPSQRAVSLVTSTHIGSAPGRCVFVGVSCAFGVLGLGLAAALCSCSGWGWRKPAATNDDVKQARERLLGEIRALDEQLLQDNSGRGTSEDQASSGSVAKPDSQVDADTKVDVEMLLQTLAKRAAQRLGPKLAKGQAIRQVLDCHMASFKRNTQAFVIQEMNCAAGSVLKAAEAEEAMLLLDWDEAVATHFPHPSVLLAGLFTPILLMSYEIMHVAQAMIIFVPVLVLCLWAFFRDLHSMCAVPSIYAWLYATISLAGVLAVTHLALAVKIHRGRAALRRDARAGEQLRAATVASREGPDDVCFSEISELFKCTVVRLQEAVLVEDAIRRSKLNWLLGVCTLLWLITAVWNFVLVLGWTFMPGIVVYGPIAPPAGESDNFCTARETIFVARVSCLLEVLIIFTQTMMMIRWVISILMTRSAGWSARILEGAQAIDDKVNGLPVVRTLAKAYLLRGTLDTPSSQLSMRLHEQSRLERERDEARRKMSLLEQRIQACAGEVGALRRRAAGDGSEPSAAAWKESGAAAIERAAARASAVEDATTQDLERLLRKMGKVVEQIQGSESVKSVLTRAGQKGHEVAEQLQNSEAVKSVMVQSTLVAEQLQQSETVRSAVAQSQLVVDRLQHSDTVRSAVTKAHEAVEQLQHSDTVSSAVAKAHQAVEQLQASEMVRSAAAQGSDVSEEFEQSGAVTDVAQK